MTAAVDLLLSRLGDGVEETRRGWQACCPAHADRRPSLAIAIGDGDRVLIHDHGGCRPEEILAAVGLTWTDLHHGGRARRDPRPTPTDPIKVALAEALTRERRRRKRLAKAFVAYHDADLVRHLHALAAEAHGLGPDHRDTWTLIALAAQAETEALLLEAELDAIDWRRPA